MSREALRMRKLPAKATRPTLMTAVLAVNAHHQPEGSESVSTWTPSFCPAAAGRWRAAVALWSSVGEGCGEARRRLEPLILGDRVNQAGILTQAAAANLYAQPA